MSDANSMPAKGALPAIHKDMKISEIMSIVPGAAAILAEYGLHCFSCSLSSLDTLEQGCALHGFSDEMLVEMLDDLNETLRAQPPREQVIIIHADAARTIGDIAKKEGQADQNLHIVADANSGFCMEFGQKIEETDKQFFNEEVPDVKIFASALTLQRIGGASIDFRDGRFKLDLPEDLIPEDSCCKDGDCACSTYKPKE